MKMCSQGKTVRAWGNRDRAGKEARQRCEFRTSLTPHRELWSVGRTTEYGFLEVRDWAFVSPPVIVHRLNDWGARVLLHCQEVASVSKASPLEDSQV